MWILVADPWIHGPIIWGTYVFPNENYNADKHIEVSEKSLYEEIGFTLFNPILF